MRSRLISVNGAKNSNASPRRMNGIPGGSEVLAMIVLKMTYLQLHNIQDRIAKAYIYVSYVLISGWSRGCEGMLTVC